MDMGECCVTERASIITSDTQDWPRMCQKISFGGGRELQPSTPRYPVRARQALLSGEQHVYQTGALQCCCAGSSLAPYPQLACVGELWNPAASDPLKAKPSYHASPLVRIPSPVQGEASTRWLSW